MRGFKLIGLTPLGVERIKANMGDDAKVVISVLNDDPFEVSFMLNRNAIRGMKRLVFNAFVNERSIRLSTSDYMSPALVNVDYLVEVIN